MPFPDGFNLAVVGTVGVEDEIIEKKVVGITWVGINGETTSTSFSTDSDVSDHAIVTGIAIAARGSKASIKEIRISRVFEIPESNQNPVDDSAGSLSRVLTLTFSRVVQNERRLRKFELPAPSNYLLDSQGAFNPDASSPGSVGGVALPSASTLLDEVDDIFPNFAYRGATTGQRKYNMQGGDRRKTTTARPAAGTDDAGVDADGTSDVT